VLLLALDGNRYNAKLYPGQVVKSMMQETELGVPVEWLTDSALAQLGWPFY